MSSRTRSTRVGGAGKAKGKSEVKKSAAEADVGLVAQVENKEPEVAAAKDAPSDPGRGVEDAPPSKQEEDNEVDLLAEADPPGGG